MGDLLGMALSRVDIPFSYILENLICSAASRVHFVKPWR